MTGAEYQLTILWDWYKTIAISCWFHQKISLEQVFAMSLLVSALICVFHVNVISCHSVFTNVAFSKPVTLSSVYSGHHGYFPGPNAVNGLLSDFVHTFDEKFPWLRIDLGARYRIHEIELFARSGCCRYKVFLYICSRYLLFEN